MAFLSDCINLYDSPDYEEDIEGYSVTYPNMNNCNDYYSIIIIILLCIIIALMIANLIVTRAIIR